MAYIHCLRTLFYSLFLILTIIPSSSSQQFDWIDNENPGSVIRSILDKDETHIAVLTDLINDDTTGIGKLDLYGINLLPPPDPGFSLLPPINLLNLGNYITVAIKYIKPVKVYLLLQVRSLDEGKYQYRAILCNDAFDILSEQKVEVLGQPVSFFIDGDSLKTIILGCTGPPYNQSIFLSFTHKNPDYLPPIDVKQATPYPLALVSSMRLDPVTGHMLVFTYDGISVVDTNLVVLQKFNSTQIQTQDHGQIIRYDNYYYSNGARDSAWNVGLRLLVLHKYDLKFNIIKADTFGYHGQDNYPFLNQSIDIQNGHILVGGHLDGPYNSADMAKHIKKYYLAKYDLDLNKIWYKEFGGDRPYIFYGVKLLEDDSGLAYGYIYNEQDEAFHGYLMHVNAQGDIITSYAQPLVNINSILVSVIEGTRLIVHNNPGAEAIFFLYDLNGHQLFNHWIDGTPIEEFDISWLPNGLYVYQVQSGNNLIKVGKIIKM